MTRAMRRMTTAATIAFVAAGGGCAGMGLDEVLAGNPGGYRSEIDGTVNRVDARNRTIQLRQDRGGTVTVRYDGSTRVTHQGRRYEASRLERGDVVTARVSRDRNGQLYTSQVLVRADARDRYGRSPTSVDRRETLQGRVGRISRGDGRFELRTGSRTVWVSLPYRPSSSVDSRFRRLRTGETIRVEGVWINRQRFELNRFR
jgi:hypothetical protein